MVESGTEPKSIFWPQEKGLPQNGYLSGFCLYCTLERLTLADADFDKFIVFAHQISVLVNPHPNSLSIWGRGHNAEISCAKGINGEANYHSNFSSIPGSAIESEFASGLLRRLTSLLTAKSAMIILPLRRILPIISACIAEITLIFGKPSTGQSGATIWRLSLLLWRKSAAPRVC